MTTLQDIRHWAAEVQPVFICGLERSGTSILQLSLSRHPALFGVKDVYETFVFLKPRSTLADPPPQMTLAYLQGQDNARRFREFCAGLAGDQPQLTENDLIRAFFHFCAHQVYPGRRPLEKTPGHVRKLPRIFELFPRARVIVCTRDPVGIVASYRKRMATEQALGKSRDDWGWLDKTPEQLIGHFQGVTASIVEARQRFPAQVWMAPYDWLTDDAEGSLRALCGFAGLEFSPEVLRPKDVPGRKVDPLLSKPLTRREPDAHEHVDEPTAAMIRAQCAGFWPLWSTPGLAATP